MMHVFEAANLGKAPFRYVSHRDRGRNNLTGCAYCGTAIRHEYLIAGSDDRSFVVGCECVYKTGDAGLINPVKKAERKHRNDAARERRAVTRKAKAATRRIIILRERREKARAILRGMPSEVRDALRVHRVPGANLDMRSWGVVVDMRERVARGIPLSEKATNYLLAIARDAFVVKAEVPESDDRVRIVGRLASIKHDEDYGWRMVVEVATERGSYKVYGSVPMAFFDKISWMMDELNERARKAWDTDDKDSLFWNSRFFERPDVRKFVGTAIEFDARVVRSSRDPSFGFFKRPTKLAVSWPTIEEWASWCSGVEGGAAMPDPHEVF